MLYLLFTILFETKSITPPTSESIDTLNIQLLSDKQKALAEAYVVNKNKHYLITTTDKNGWCQIPLFPTFAKDTIEFAYLGFHTQRIALKDLKNNDKITLQTEQKLLEPVVIEGFDPMSLLKKVSKDLQPIDQKYKINFYGKAQYEKLKIYNHRAVEFLQEYGFYFTSGNVPVKGDWDSSRFFELVPEHAARSNNQLPAILYPLRKEGPYDIGSRKLLTVLQAIQHFSPLFTNLKYYKFDFIKSEDVHYVYSFSIKKRYIHRKDIYAYGRGTLKINHETHELSHIYFDELKYKFYRTINTPALSTLNITFAHNENGTYFKCANLTTTWLYQKKCYIEKEALQCETFSRLPLKKQQNPSFEEDVKIASRHVCVLYNEELFQALKPLIERNIIFEQIGKFHNIFQQFRFNNGEYYIHNEQSLHQLFVNDYIF